MKHLPEKISLLDSKQKCYYLGYLIRNKETLMEYLPFIMDQLVELINDELLEPDLLIPLAWLNMHIGFLYSNHQNELFNICQLLFDKSNRFLINNCLNRQFSGNIIHKYNDLFDLIRHIIKSVKDKCEEDGERFLDLSIGNEIKLKELNSRLNELNAYSMISYQLLINLHRNMVTSNEYKEDHFNSFLKLIMNYVEMIINNRERNTNRDIFMFQLIGLFKYYDVTKLDEFVKNKHRLENSVKQLYKNNFPKFELNYQFISNLTNYIHIMISLNMTDMDAFRFFSDNLDDVYEMVSQS